MVTENKSGAATIWLASIFLLKNYFKELVDLFYKSVIPFLTFTNCKDSYFAERFLRNLCLNISILCLRNNESSQK